MPLDLFQEYILLYIKIYSYLKKTIYIVMTFKNENSNEAPEEKAGEVRYVQPHLEKAS